MSTAPVSVPVTIQIQPKTSNGFVSFLKRLGGMFKTGATEALRIEAKLIPAEEAVGAALTIVNPAVGGTFEAILASVVKVEQIATAVGASHGTGEQKLVAALPDVEAAVLSNPLFKGKTIANLGLWNSALEKITGAVADLTSSVQ